MTSTTAASSPPHMASIGDSSSSQEEYSQQQKKAPNEGNEAVHAVSSDCESSTSSSASKEYNNESRYEYRRQESAVRDAVCASTALMGENILDSPTQQYNIRMFQLRDRSALGTPSSPRVNHSLADIPAPPSLETNGNSNGRGSRSDPPLTEENSNAMTVGIMAQGLAWARRQRDRRQRQYLQLQAEQQLRKIRQAQEQQQQEEEDEAPRSLIDNSIFRNLAATNSGTLRSGSGSFSDAGDLEEDQHENKKKTKTFDVTKKVSKSGDGYSVELPGVVLDGGNSRDEEDASWVPPVRVEDESSDLSTCPFLLSASEMQQIAVHVLPKGISYCKWKRHYSLARDGDSFENCLRNVENVKQSLLVVRTTRNAVFGGFADEAWEPHMQGGACFYGGATACLFKVIPAPENDNAAAAAASLSTKVKYFRWSGANRYVQLCDVSNKMLAFGGGGRDGAFGLCVEQDFQVGSTGPCATFENEPLCDQENFDIVDMEIYGFMLGQF